MNFYDFKYDDIYLSDFGCMICRFGSGGMETVSNGSQITFNTVSTNNGNKYEHTSSQYDECIEATFQICKNPCKHKYKDLEFSFNEIRKIMSWLNRNGFHKIKFFDVQDDYIGYYFEASFNVSRIEVAGSVVGFELNMKTNSPFALGEEVAETITGETTNWSAYILNKSDEEGYIYPHTEITLKQGGSLNIQNEFESRNTFIRNCTSGEIITMDYPVIQTSLSSHKIQDDFNWNFFRIASSFNQKKNNIVVSLPCTIKLKYSPIVKIGI